MPNIRITDDQAKLLRELYELDSLVNRHGTEEEGQRPPARTTTDYVRSLLLMEANATAVRVDTLAQQEGLYKAQEAIDAGASGSEGAAIVRETKAEVWQRLTGHDSWSSWLLTWTKV